MDPMSIRIVPWVSHMRGIRSPETVFREAESFREEAFGAIAWPSSTLSSKKKTSSGGLKKLVVCCDNKMDSMQSLGHYPHDRVELDDAAVCDHQVQHDRGSR